jgi:hypothetical protein
MSGELALLAWYRHFKPVSCYDRCVKVSVQKYDKCERIILPGYIFFAQARCTQTMVVSELEKYVRVE